MSERPTSVTEDRKVDAVDASFLCGHKLEAGYGHTTVLEDVNIKVNREEAVCILGGNGSGKSTLLKVIYGLLHHRSGNLVFNGMDLQGVAPHVRYSHGIVLVPQDRRLFANKTVRENLELACLSTGQRANDIARERERVYETLPFLHEAAKKPAGVLSGGEQQVVALGRALMTEPKLLLMDEPSAGLSPKWIQTIEEAVYAAAREYKLTYLLVEQNVKVGCSLTKRAYILRNGIVAHEGESQHLIHDEALLKSYFG